MNFHCIDITIVVFRVIFTDAQENDEEGLTENQKIFRKILPRSHYSREHEKDIFTHIDDGGYADTVRVHPLQIMTTSPFATEGRQYWYCTCIASPA